jgi:beta-lactamase class A
METKSINFRVSQLPGNVKHHHRLCRLTLHKKLAEWIYYSYFPLDFFLYISNNVVVMKKLIEIIALCTALSLIAVGPVSSYRLPADLVESCDPVLQKGLEKCLVSLNLKRATLHKALSIVLVDITDPTVPRMAYVNPNEMMYAASLPKIAILLGAFERIANGEMTLDFQTRKKMSQMIRNSSNRAATEILNKVGKAYLAKLLQSSRYRLYDPERNGGLWVGKEYSKAGAWKRDPLHNLSHGATALQVARFYYMLQTGQLVSPDLSRQMKTILADPAIEHKFVKGLKSVHPDSQIYRKSGTWREYHSDSAIIEHDGRRYIAVALAKSQRGDKWLSELIVAMDDLIFKSVPSDLSNH